MLTFTEGDRCLSCGDLKYVTYSISCSECLQYAKKIDAKNGTMYTAYVDNVFKLAFKKELLNRKLTFIANCNVKRLTELKSKIAELEKQYPNPYKETFPIDKIPLYSPVYTSIGGPILNSTYRSVAENDKLKDVLETHNTIGRPLDLVPGEITYKIKAERVKFFNYDYSELERKIAERTYGRNPCGEVILGYGDCLPPPRKGRFDTPGRKWLPYNNEAGGRLNESRPENSKNWLDQETLGFVHPRTAAYIKAHPKVFVDDMSEPP